MKLFSTVVLAYSVGLAGLAGGCAGEGDEPGHTERPVVGGSTATSDLSIVAISVPVSDGSPVLRVCTGTVISPRTVLTAAQCIYDAKVGGFLDQGRVYFGYDQGNPDRVVLIADARPHRLYDPSLSGKYDLAVVLLAEDAMVAPAVLNDQPLEGTLQVFNGSNPTEGKVRSVGYGAGVQNMATGMVSGAGTRRTNLLSVRSIAPRHFTIGDNDNFICGDGDEGGPDLFDFGGTEKVVAVHAGINDSRKCETTAVTMRVDAALDDFIIPAMDAWEGPCSVDGTCVTTGCRTPDPDCDPCGPEGTCAPDCPQADWDCPLGLLVGEACTMDSECETRRCIGATDDPRITYCSDTCSPDSAALDCGSLTCAQIGGENLCAYAEPTPGAQGADCATGGDCRSGLCDLEYLICVEECDPTTADACPAGFECSPSSLADNVCRPPSTGGGGCGCSAGARGGALGGGGLALAGLAGVAAVLLRRRRRPSARA